MKGDLLIKFSHLAPTQWIKPTAYASDCFLTLAHLVEQYPEYVYATHAACYEAEQSGREIVKIMDNGIFELFKEHGPGYVFDPAKLLDLGRTIGAEYIVLPDYPAEPWKKTTEAALKFAPMFKNHGFGTFFCPQSELGNLEDYIHSIDWASRSDLVDYIGISILGVPNAFNVEKTNKLQRFTCRAWLMKLLNDRGILDRIVANGKKIHFLGMVDGPNEIEFVSKWHSYIASWDSSAAIWAGINGIKFDNSPTGMLNGKFEKLVDFDRPLDSYADSPLIWEAVEHNLRRIDALLGKFV